MNTIVSYLMGIALYVVAFFLPHQTETSSNSDFYKLEEKSETLSENQLTISDQKLEENIQFKWNEKSTQIWFY